MIGKLFRLLRTVFLYGCVATVLAQVILLGVFLARHGFSREQVFDMLAIAYKIDLDAIAEENAGLAALPTSEQVSYEQVVEARLKANLDHDLRQQSLDMALRDLRGLQIEVLNKQERLDLQAAQFSEHLASLETQTEQESIRELSATLQAIQPRQAKEQLVLMLEDAILPEEDSMLVVVAILKAMPLDKRKRILEEFKTEDEAITLAEILREIRLGEPDMSVIREAREQIDQYEPRVAEGPG